MATTLEEARAAREAWEGLAAEVRAAVPGGRIEPRRYHGLEDIDKPRVYVRTGNGVCLVVWKRLDSPGAPHYGAQGWTGTPAARGSRMLDEVALKKRTASVRKVLEELEARLTTARDAHTRVLQGLARRLSVDALKLGLREEIALHRAGLTTVAAVLEQVRLEGFDWYEGDAGELADRLEDVAGRRP